MKGTNYMKNPKKVGKVIRTPGFILRIQGKMDSKKGKGVCDEYIQSVVRKLASMEGDEVIQAENALHDVRKEAAVILAEFSEKKEALSEIPENTGGKTVEEIRDNRRKSTRRKDAANRLKEAMNKLTTINEQIINTNTVLDERINKLRNNAAEAEQTDVPAVLFASLFNGVIPLLTSISSFVISYFSCNPVGLKLSRLVLYGTLSEFSVDQRISV